MDKPRLLDLFCGAGGCSVGYSQAGFEVVGVDNKPQKRYPFAFVQMDALEALRILLAGGYITDTTGRRWYLTDFAAIGASPPCQAFTSARVIHGRKHSDLLTPTRALLEKTGRPWVIENVPGAPMRADIVLCGSHFGLKDGTLGLIRHRWFEFFKPPFVLMPPCAHTEETVSVFGHGGHIYHGVESWRRAMGIDWMTRDELAQAIPPVFTEFIGRQLMQYLEVIS